MRYMGSKVKIVDQIDDLIKSLKIDKENYTFFDAFSGTATVGNHFKDKFKSLGDDNPSIYLVDYNEYAAKFILNNSKNINDWLHPMNLDNLSLYILYLIHISEPTRPY